MAWAISSTARTSSCSWVAACLTVRFIGFSCSNAPPHLRPRLLGPAFLWAPCSPASVRRGGHRQDPCGSNRGSRECSWLRHPESEALSLARPPGRRSAAPRGQYCTRLQGWRPGEAVEAMSMTTHGGFFTAEHRHGDVLERQVTVLPFPGEGPASVLARLIESVGAGRVALLLGFGPANLEPALRDSLRSLGVAPRPVPLGPRRKRPARTPGHRVPGSRGRDDPAGDRSDGLPRARRPG